MDGVEEGMYGEYKGMDRPTSGCGAQDNPTFDRATPQRMHEAELYYEASSSASRWQPWTDKVDRGTDEEAERQGRCWKRRCL